MTKTIAIIGANGNTGSTIAARLAKANYRLLLFSHEPGELTSLVEKIKRETPSAEIECMGCAINATWEADIIISTIALNDERELVTNIKPFANRKVVISISSGEENDNRIASKAMTTTQELQNLLPGAKVVKLFNISFDHEGHGPAVMTGNDQEALKFAKEILKLAGCSDAELISKKIA
jgi:predicted dinucleotide-binding enzyme